MRAVDAWAIERAGRAVARPDGARRRRAWPASTAEVAPARGRSASWSGKGNNGGDGLVAARLLREDGHEVRRARPSRRPTSCAATRARTSSGSRASRRRPSSRRALAGSGAVVDALLGTGFEGEPREPVAGAIAAINAAGRAGGGLRRALGRERHHAARSQGEAVRAAADRDLPRLEGRALTWSPARRHAGEVEVVEIGVPRGAPAPERGRPDLRARARALSRSRPRNGSKFELRRGGGGGRSSPASPARPRWPRGRPSAPAPATCRWRCPPRSQLVVELRLLEAMTRALPDEDGAHTPAGGRAGSSGWPSGPAPWCSGPGSAAARARRSSRARSRGAVEKPLLIDADGLNAHAGRLELLAGRAGPDRAHPARRASSARLLGTDSARGRRAHGWRTRPRGRGAERLRGAAEGRRLDRGGARRPGWRSARGPRPALATAGTGDVLSGHRGRLPRQGAGRLRGRGGRRARPRAGRPARPRRASGPTTRWPAT